MNAPGQLSCSISQNIATITFGHPSGNSLPAALLQKLAETIEDMGRDDAVSLLVIKSEGDGAFCAGASFDELLAVEDVAAGTQFFSGFAHVINAIRKCPKLIVGRVQGKTVGGGVGLAAAFDYTFAIEKSLVKLSELAIGIGPFVIAPVIERKAGIAALSELSLDPENWKTAIWAQQKGLFTAVYNDIETLDAAMETFVSKLASYNPEARAQMKKILWEGTEHWSNLLYERAAISGSLVLSDFTKHALAHYRK